MPPASGGYKPIINQEQAGTYKNMVRAHKTRGFEHL